jgi:hypothetical protein
VRGRVSCWRLRSSSGAREREVYFKRGRVL